MAELWSDYTDMLISGIDKQLGSKYKFSLAALLTNPNKYASQPNIQISIGNMKEDVDKYIDDKVKAMADEQKDLDDAASKADSVTGQLSRSISMQAKQNNIPMIRPVSIDRNTDREETIYIDTIDTGVSSLVQKLVSSAILVVDLSAGYKNYNIGSWLFSGSKNYVLNVYMPDSTLLALEASRLEINGLLELASNTIKGL
jgi:hypothetical protein